jgi:GT2 family glycosyltransferase
LYHWRAIPGSCAGTLTAKPYALARQLQAISDHLDRQGIDNVKVFTGNSGEIRAVWPAKGRKVSIIVPTRDKVGFVKKCLASLLERTTYNDFEIILVDNGSKEKATHDYYQVLGREPRVRIIDYNAPFNYSHANNLGAEHAQGELLLFLNNDTEALVPDWLEELARWAEQPRIGVVGAKLLYPDSTIQHAGLVIGMDGQVGPVFQGANNDHQGIFGSVQWYRNYTTVSGACMMIPRRVFDQVGGFDESYLLAHSDVEICLRIALLGLRIVYTPFAVLRHYEGRTRFNHVPLEDHQLAYQQMQQRVAAGDPYFNPNLSYVSAIPRLKEKSEEDRLLRLQRFLRESGVTQHRAKSA